MTPQEQFWRGTFGDEYAKRSPGDVVANIEFFREAFNLGIRTRPGQKIKPESVIEFGAGVGNNLRAIHSLLPEAKLCGVEINEDACPQLMATPASVCNESLLDFPPPNAVGRQWDLSLTKGVLIHIAPEDLRRAYDVLWRASSRYILLAEYYNPKPVAIEYRGHVCRLWKRDFAGEMLDIYPDLRLVDYGFVYHRDQFPQDDITWFLMEKRQ